MRRASEFVKNLRFEDLDEDTIQGTKDCLLDFMGAVLGGAKTRAGEISLEFVKNFAGPGHSTIWCTGGKTTPQGATFVHGTIGSALDIDDGHRMAVGHPGGVVIPAAFSVSENNECSGRELIEAIVCGYEVGIRSGNIHRSETSQFAVIPGSGRWGSLGAAAAVAKVLRLDLEEIEQALAMSATFAPVAPVIDDLINKGFMPMTKFSSGWGGMVGICSALLAKEGFTGISSVIRFSTSSLPDFGEGFEIKNVYFKPYPCCRWTHPAVEGTLDLMEKHKDLRRDTIQKISLKTFSAASHLREPRPQTMESAQYSIPFLVGTAVINGRITPDQIAEERLSDPNVLGIADRVEISHSPEFDDLFPGQIPTEIEIETTSGRRYRTEVVTPKGDPQNPMSATELIDKFRSLATGSIDSRASEKLVEKIGMLDRVDNVLELSHVFQKHFEKQN